MTYNNLETQVTSVSGTWSTAAGFSISFSTLGLSTSIPFKDQIEVERIFSSSAFTAVKNNITTADLHKIFLLTKTEYTITGNTISAFSMDGTRSYTLTGGSSSGTAIPIPAISNGDSVIIRRKTLSMDTYVTWAPGTKLTTTQLNQQVGQLLRLNQELIYKLDTEYVRAADLSGSVAPVLVVNNNLNMNSYQILNLATPSSAVGSDTGAGVNKGYVDTNFVNKSTAQTGIAGAKTFTGAITLSSTLAVTGAVTLSSGLTVDTNTLVVDATNDRVGIGTANPTRKLEVSTAAANNLEVLAAVRNANSGTGVAAAGNTGRFLDIYNHATGASALSGIRLITHNASTPPAPSSIGQMLKYQTGGFVFQNTDTNAAAHMAFSVGNTERMRIDSAGRVGIGAASSGNKLAVTTTGVGSDGIHVINSDNRAYGSLHAQGTTGGIASWANGFVIEGVPASTGNTILSSYTGALSFQTARAERMRINSSGALLHGGTEIGNTGTISLVPGGSSPFNNKLVFGTDGTGYKFAIASQQGANASVNRLVIQDNGNVGIATDSPSTKLAVNGTTSISGVTTLSSTEASSNTTSGALQVGGGVGIAGNLHVGNTINAGSTIATTSSIQTMTGSAPAAGGVNCITLTSSNIAIIVASASPNGVITAPKGSLCINTGASAGNTRLWINTNSGTTWAAVTSG
jgi:hypothetical protein